MCEGKLKEYCSEIIFGVWLAIFLAVCVLCIIAEKHNTIDQNRNEILQSMLDKEIEININYE